jgi:type IV pilus assembly protein PilA
MKKLLSRLNAKKNNKGFTLVELIIVIAIIAVLAAVLAPQYIKYVEKSREATDANAVNEIAHAAEVAYVGDGTTQPTGEKFTITVDANGGVTYTKNAVTDTLSDEVAGIAASSAYTMKSKAYKGATITITLNDGKATVGAVTKSGD